MYHRLVVSNWFDFRVSVLLFVFSYLRLVLLMRCIEFWLFRFLIHQLFCCSCWLLRGAERSSKVKESAGEMDRRVNGFSSHPRRNKGWQFTARSKFINVLMAFVHIAYFLCFVPCRCEEDVCFWFWGWHSELFYFYLWNFVPLRFHLFLRFIGCWCSSFFGECAGPIELLVLRWLGFRERFQHWRCRICKQNILVWHAIHAE